MNWTMVKLGFKWMFGGKEAVLDYVLDLANCFAVGLKDTVKERAQSTLEAAKKILAVLEEGAKWCPAKWREDYAATVAAFRALCDAVQDLQLTLDEVRKVSETFRLAYSEWRT